MADETKTTTTTPEVDYKAEYEKSQSDYAKLKASFDKASSEIADFKRRERERMSDDDKKAAEAEEREKYYKDLERRIAISDYSAHLDDIPDSKLRTEIAELFADGKIVEAMSKHKEYRSKDREELKKEIKAELMKQNPQSNPQGGSAAYKTKDEILAIKDTKERQKAIAENISLFQ